MNAAFYRPDDPERVVGSARWDGARVHLDAEDPELRAALERIFRASPVAVRDSATRPTGSEGHTVVPPGDLQWFLTAARVRGEQEAFGVRFSTTTPGGWDPAGAYRPMNAWISLQEGTPLKTGTLGAPST